MMRGMMFLVFVMISVIFVSMVLAEEMTLTGEISSVNGAIENNPGVVIPVLIVRKTKTEEQHFVVKRTDFLFVEQSLINTVFVKRREIKFSWFPTFKKVDTDNKNLLTSTKKTLLFFSRLKNRLALVINAKGVILGIKEVKSGGIDYNQVITFLRLIDVGKKIVVNDGNKKITVKLP